MRKIASRRDARNGSAETYRLFSHPSGMQLVNGIDPGVSKTQPLATFLHRSAVIALLRSATAGLGRQFSQRDVLNDFEFKPFEGM